MTREKAILLVANCTINSYDYGNLKHSVDKIYDDFEKRTCDNCKHWNCNTGTPSKGFCNALGVHNIGGCGDYFEER